MTSERVCIIGAGLSGIAAAKQLKQRGIPFDCFEKGSDIGGIWRYNNDNGMSSIYASLHTNTSKQLTRFSDFPMPEDYPDHPHHSQVFKYLKDYVDNFSLRDHITFGTLVTDVSPLPNGEWEVTRDHTVTDRYQAVLVANGHHWYPKWASFPGTFSGKTLHAHDYKTVKGFEDLNVLVIGIGSSGADIACEVSRVARQTFLSTRRSMHILPKYLRGRPIDHFSSSFGSRFPVWFQSLSFGMLLWLTQGPQSAYGIPEPNYKLLTAPVTISSELFNRVKQGQVNIKPNVKELVGEQVVFVDGTEEQIDVIIYATGYHLSFPFFKPSFIEVKEKDLPLYHQVIHPDYPNLFFVGLLQTPGPILAVAELQSQWVGGLLNHEFKLPSRETMWRVIKRQYQKLCQRYPSTEQKMLVDYYPYVRTLQSEMRSRRIS